MSATGDSVRCSCGCGQPAWNQPTTTSPFLNITTPGITSWFNCAPTPWVTFSSNVKGRGTYEYVGKHRKPVA